MDDGGVTDEGEGRSGGERRKGVVKDKKRMKGKQRRERRAGGRGGEGREGRLTDEEARGRRRGRKGINKG